MAEKKMGKQSVKFQLCSYIIGSASVVGKKEGQGPMARWFDHCLDDDIYGEKTWEKAESKMLKEAMKKLSEREKKIIDMRFYRGKTQMEIAEEIGISQAQVSRLEKGALMRIRKQM